MKEFIRRINLRRKSLSVRLPLLFIASSILIFSILLYFVYGRFENRMIGEYTRMADGLTQLVVNAVDGDKIDEYIDKNFESEEYCNIVKYLYTLKYNYPDVHYLYIYKVTPEGGIVVFDLDDDYAESLEQENIDWIGEIYEMDEPFASDIPFIMEGSADISHAVHTQDGEYLLSYLTPILDSEGNYAASACVDFSMDNMHSDNVYFIIQLGTLLSIIMLIAWTFETYMLKIIVLNPIDKIMNCVRNFKYETTADRKKNVELLEGCVLKTDNEVDELRDALLFSMKDNEKSITELTQAKDEMNEIAEIVRRDALTHVGSKAYYDETIHNLQKKIDKQSAQFSIVMIDINNLKMINDTYGHDMGNDYILGCTHVICDTYKKSPVFRIGGDEFVVLLTGPAYNDRDTLLEDLKKAFEKAYNEPNKEIYERYTASVGMATYIPHQDKEVGDVFSRADNLMYQDKKNFKKNNDSYR